MRPLITMSSIAIEVTNACNQGCSNCTQLVGHAPKPYFMTMNQFMNAVDSMVDFPGVTGIQGGEPLLHPDFEEMCEYAVSKIPKEKLGLWTCLPEGFEDYRVIIVNTFGHIFLNDHTRDDILHHPILVASEEMPCEEWKKKIFIDSCWVQNMWSAAIIGDRAYFCEVGAALAELLHIESHSVSNTELRDITWEVEPGWWTRSPIDFVDQINALCKYCGCAMPLKKRVSTEKIDDISPKMYEKLKDTSPKIKKGKYEIHDLQFVEDRRQAATYKDQEYRQGIANKYGMFLMLNEIGYQTPYLKNNWKGAV